MRFSCLSFKVSNHIYRPNAACDQKYVLEHTFLLKMIKYNLILSLLPICYISWNKKRNSYANKTYYKTLNQMIFYFHLSIYKMSLIKYFIFIILCFLF